ncbi:MAG TPA: ACT domain-containing protein [bacterium]|nr:ACT domain-containing protein [bacterium]
MKSYLLLTAVGPDRPGLVDDVSAYLAQRSINIESSRMAVLGGEFAMIMLASGDAAEVDRAVAYPAELAKNTGLQLWVKRTEPPEARVAPASLPYRIVTAGMDHPGIVHDISKVLHSFAANIESMDTRVTPAPVSGTPMFTMEAVISVPAEVKVKKLKEALQTLGDELNMDIEFEPVEAR